MARLNGTKANSRRKAYGRFRHCKQMTLSIFRVVDNARDDILVNQICAESNSNAPVVVAGF